jgi:hypothetical protein
MDAQQNKYTINCAAKWKRYGIPAQAEQLADYTSSARVGSPT